MLKSLVVFAALVVAALTVAPASAGGNCPRNTNCAIEMRPDIVRTTVTKTVTVQLCISQSSWEALVSYWRANGKSGRCFWGAQSVDKKSLTGRIYGPCGTVTVLKGKVYGYDGRAGQSHRWGPF